MAASHLPDEILVKIIKEYVEPYSLQVGTKAGLKRNADGSPKTMLRCEQAPKVMNMLLVNKTFKHETIIAVAEKFSGNVLVANGSISILAGSLKSTDRNLLSTLRLKIRHISFGDDELATMRDVGRLLNAQYMPGLIQVTLTAGRMGKFLTPPPIFAASVLATGGVVADLSSGSGFWNGLVTTRMYHLLTSTTNIAKMVQTRRIHVVANVFYGEAGNDKVAGLTFACTPVRDRDVENGHISVLGRSTLEENAVTSFMKRCETPWEPGTISQRMYKSAEGLAAS